MADQPGSVSSQIPQEKLRGRYCNSVTISHTPYEFIFDFAQASLDHENKKVHVEFIERLVMSPQHAAAFLAVFEKHFKEFQNRPPQEPPKGFDFGEGGKRPL